MSPLSTTGIPRLLIPQKVTLEYHRNPKIVSTTKGHPCDLTRSDFCYVDPCQMVCIGQPSEVEDRSLVGKPKKTRSKVVEEDMRKLNITEDMAEHKQ